MARERKHDYSWAITTALNLTRDLYRHKPLHEDWCVWVRERLYEQDAYKRLTIASRAEVRGILYAATETLHIIKAVVWAHKVDGVWHRAPLQFSGYDRIEESQFMWDEPLLTRVW